VAVFIGSVVLHVSENARAAAFWSEALGYAQVGANPDFLGPAGWEPPSRSRADHGEVHLHVDEDDRTHLDLWLEEGDDLQAEVERLISLGATRVEWNLPEDADHVVLADPDGNLFCVVP
jgi:catechol 2,3-dioxygenase-like lactoylglutathione lyase family enzyme